MKPSQCETEPLTLLAAGMLSPEEAERVRRHVDGCVSCQLNLASFQEMAQRVRNASRFATVGPSLAMMARWERGIHASAAPPHARAHAVAARQGMAAWLQNLWATRRVPLTGLAALWALIAYYHLAAPSLPPPAVGTARVSAHRVLALLRVRLNPAPEGLEPLIDPTPRAAPDPVPSRIRSDRGRRAEFAWSRDARGEGSGSERTTS